MLRREQLRLEKFHITIYCKYVSDHAQKRATTTDANNFSINFNRENHARIDATMIMFEIRIFAPEQVRLGRCTLRVGAGLYRLDGGVAENDKNTGSSYENSIFLALS